MSKLISFLGSLSVLVASAYSTAETPSIATTTPPTHQHLSTLDEYIEYGLTNSSSLRAAYDSYRAAIARQPQVTALPDPTLKFGHFIRSVETRVGAQKNRVGIAQPFPWFGTLGLRGEVADAETQAEFNRFLSLKNKLVFDITKSYAELAYLHDSVEITKDIIELVKSWEMVLQDRFRTGSGSHSDLVRVQVELGKLEDRLVEFQDFINPLSVTLNSLINRNVESLIQVGKRSIAITQSIDSHPMDFAQVILGNPELLMLDAIIKAKGTGVKLAEKKFYPDLSLGVDYVFTGDRDINDGGKDAVMAMLSMSLPVFWQKNQGAIDEARSRQKTVKEMKKQLEFSLRSDFSRAQFNLRDARRKISLYKHTLIPKTQEAIEASYTAYEGGRTGFIDVLDSQRQLLDFDLSLSRAQADRIIAITKLHTLIGSYSERSSASKEN